MKLKEYFFHFGSKSKEKIEQKESHVSSFQVNIILILLKHEGLGAHNFIFSFNMPSS